VPGPAPWPDRDFRLLWTGGTASRLGSSVTTVVLPLVAVQTLHASTFTVGLLAALAWLPWLVVGLPAGALVDRWPRRRAMLVSDIASALLLASVPAAAWSGVLTTAHLLAVTTLTGVATVFFQTANTSYLPAVVGPDRLADANARLKATESAAQVAGPGLGGLIAQVFGAVAGLCLDAASFLMSALCLTRIRVTETPRPRADRRPLHEEIGTGLRFVAGDPYLRVFAVYGAASNLALMGYQAILVVFLVRSVGLSAGAVGGLMAVTLLGGVAGAALATRLARRFGTARGLLLSKLVSAPFGLLIPLTAAGPRLWCFVLGSTVLIGGVVAGNVITDSFRQAYCPPHLLGRALTSMQFVNFGTIPVGALLGGTLGTVLGLRPTLWVMTGLFAVTGLLLFLGPLRRLRDLPTRPADTPADRRPSPALR
jgi:MFS family permease